MQKVESGQRYKHNVFGDYCTINGIAPRGRGYQVCYKRDGDNFGLITSRGNFLQNYTLDEQSL
jgi:hypothetical protein